jgi:CheY-like chemotaxis protein
MNRSTIQYLLIENDIVYARRVLLLLASPGDEHLRTPVDFRGRHVESVAEALALSRSQSFQLVLIDAQQATADGGRALNDLRVVWPLATILVLESESGENVMSHLPSDAADGRVAPGLIRPTLFSWTLWHLLERAALSRVLAQTRVELEFERRLRKEAENRCTALQRRGTESTPAATRSGAGGELVASTWRATDNDGLLIDDVLVPSESLLRDMH